MLFIAIAKGKAKDSIGLIEKFCKGIEELSGLVSDIVPSVRTAETLMEAYLSLISLSHHQSVKITFYHPQHFPSNIQNVDVSSIMGTDNNRISNSPEQP